MADIRIKDLATTATTTVSDDYLAIDGATNGTRKMSAYSPVFSGGVADAGGTIAAQRNGLAPAQGLSFVGVNPANISIAAFSTGAFTVAATVNWSDVTSGYRAIVGNTANLNNFFFGTQSATGEIGVIKTGGTWKTSGVVLAANATTHIAYVRTSTGANDARFYINGVLVATITDANDYTLGLNVFGGNAGTNNTPTGTISKFVIENRSLSAAEVLALYQTSAIQSGDINLVTNDSGVAVGASNTSLVTGANSTFASNTGWWTLAGGTPATISGGVANFPAGSSTVARANFLKVGSIYSLLVGSKTGTLVFDGGTAATPITAATAIVFTATQTTLQFYTAAGGTMDDVTLTPLGALIAPEANALGYGTTWLDTSGNAANITLPASGVSWALPSAQNYGRTQGTLSGTTPAITFSDNEQGLDWTLTGNSTPTASGYAAGRNVNLFITGDTSTRTFTWPAWTWIGGSPASSTANKKMRIALECRGTTAASVFATYAEQL